MGNKQKSATPPARRFKVASSRPGDVPWLLSSLESLTTFALKTKFAPLGDKMLSTLLFANAVSSSVRELA